MHKAFKALIIAGILVFCCGAGLIGFLYTKASISSSLNEKRVNLIHRMLPQPAAGLWMDENENMPVFHLEGQDIAALIEFPRFDVELPVSAYWDTQNIMSLPCVYSGSLYQSQFIIGGYDMSGQFDFFDQLDLYDSVYIMDMKGHQTSYVVSAIERSSSISYDILTKKENHLTLFVKDAQTTTYLIVRCSLSPKNHQE